jgi:FG-GAP-like repeat
MTRLSATATIAALLLLAIAQGFGATSPTRSTKSSPKIASKSTAKPYHVTAQNQFHIKSAKRASSPALARFKAKEQQRTRGPLHPGAIFGATAPRKLAQRRAVRAHKNQTNPPTGKIGFVSATQISAGGFLNDTNNQVLSGALGTSTALFTVVDTGAGCAYSEVVANGDGTFTTLVPTAPATLTLVPVPGGTAGNDCGPAFVVGDVNGDGNSDIVQADVSAGVVTISVLLANGDGTFTPAAAGLGPASGFTLVGVVGATGGTLVPNATSGFLDIWILDDSEPSNLAQYAGNGDGTFTLVAAPGVSVNPPVALIPPTTPNLLDGVANNGNVIIEDLDGDGIPDVAENDFFNNQVAVYLSTATAAPYTGVELSTPDGVFDGFCGSTAGSLTGSSGLPAIVQTNCGDNTITVYNNSAGVFSEGVYYPAAAVPSTPDLYPEGVTVADVNGDGNGDVVVTNDDTSDVTVLLGNGDGTLQLASMGYATGGFPFTAAIVEDLNGDGLADILVADDNQSLVWMAGFGDGTFQASKNFYAPILDNSYGYSYSIASGDFNGDGFTDVVVSNFGGTSTGITVFLSNPDGSLQPGVNYGSSGEFGYLTVSDFNGDGKWDIAASNYNGYVQIFTGTGSGTFIEGPFYSTGGSEGAGIVAGALNNSTNGTGVAGFNDLAVYNFGSSNISVLVNDGSGGFLSPVPYPLSAGGQMLATAQLTTTSGNLDLAAAEYEGSEVGVLLGNGDGTFAAEATVPMGDTPFGITLADVSGDGIPDIVATDDSQNILVATGKGDGTFPTAVMSLPSSLDVFLTSPFFNPQPWSVQVTDVDGDGVADLVYTNWEYSTVGVIFGQGTGTATVPTFFDPVEFPTTQDAFGLTIADVNGDGSPDAVASDDDIAGAGVLINGNGTAAAPNYSLSSNTSFINIQDGGTGTATITLTPVNFYSGTVTFSCGGLPLDVTCAFAPATLTPLGNAPLQTTLTVTTAAPHGALRMPADANPHQGRTSLLACLTGMGLFGLLLSGDWKNKRNRRVGILLGILVLGMMFSLVGCSSSTTPGTPIGAQTIQVTGTGSDAAATTQSVNVTINVF